MENETATATATEAPPKSFKVGCKTKGDDNWAYNGMRFKTAEAAKRYGSDLYSRWTALDSYEVHPSDEEPTPNRFDGTEPA